MSCDCNPQIEEFAAEALCVAQQSCLEIGIVGKFVIRNEDNISRDKYKSIIEYQEAISKTYNICICNIKYSPNSDDLTKSGLYENAEVSILTPSKCWLDNLINFGDIIIKKTTVVLDGEVYHIKEKNKVQIIMGNIPMYFSFGLVKN